MIVNNTSTAVGLMSHNARRLGEVADGARHILSYHQRSSGAESFWSTR